MAKKQAYLDQTQKHTLTEQECELISIFRLFSKSKRETIFKMLFFTALGNIDNLTKVDKE